LNGDTPNGSGACIAPCLPYSVCCCCGRERRSREDPDRRL
jgi:hypothetical protein